MYYEIGMLIIRLTALYCHAFPKYVAIAWTGVPSQVDHTVINHLPLFPVTLTRSVPASLKFLMIHIN